MKGLFTLCNDIFNGSSSTYRTTSGNVRRESRQSLPFGISKDVFHKKIKGESNIKKSKFFFH